VTSISVIIITFNEEKYIGQTIAAAAKIADEIIVADSGSTDQTRAICEAAGVRFLERSWTGYGDQRNHAASLATHDIILALDADEVLSEALIEAILAEKQKNFPSIVYTLDRLNNYYGKFVYHGIGYPDHITRLYDKHKAQWNNRAVHETLEYGSTLKPALLKGKLLHYTTDSISDHIIKSDRYSSLSAQHYFEKGKREPGFIKLVISPAIRFFKGYILKAGFLDGWQGYILAKMHAKVVFDKYAKLKMLYCNKLK
jgi:glycosyltransferase involved in cell wall biosynthesis